MRSSSSSSSRRRRRRMMNLKDAIIAELSTSTNPSMAIDPELIDLRLQQLLPTFQTPSHPPYSSMIRQAILKLNEDCGSTEEAISMHLEREYRGLPWAHASFLSHHLNKLCSSGELVCVGNERYMISVDDGGIENVEKGDRALVQGKGSEVEDVGGWSGVNVGRVSEFKNRCEVEGQSAEESVRNTECEQRMEDGRAAESENQCEFERTEGLEEQKEVRKEPLKVVQEEGQNFSSQIEVSHHLEKHEEIDCANKEHYMVQVDGGYLEMSHQLSISDRGDKELQTLVQVKGREVEAIDGSNGVNIYQAAESENRCEVERLDVEVSGQNKTCEKRMEGLEEQKEVAEEVDAEKGDLTKVTQKQWGLKRKRQQKTKQQIKKKGFRHRLNISDRAEKEDQTLVQVLESENPWEVERHSVEVSDQSQACKQRMEEFENEGRRESLKGVREERLNLSGPVEVAEEVELVKEMLTKAVRNRRGQKRKQQAKTKQPRKVLKKDDTSWPTMEVEKKYVEERQQQMISELVHAQDLENDNRTKMQELPNDSDVKLLKTSFPKRSGRLLEKQKKAALNHGEQQKRKLCVGERGLFIVCALPASPSRTNIDPKACKRPTDPRSASLELRESGEILLRELKHSTPRKPRSLRGNTSKSSTQSAPKPDGVSKNQELEKQEKQFREYRKLPEYELKTKQANFGGDKAAISPSIKRKNSMDQGIVCALAASQSKTNINPKARMPLTGSMSTSLESSESGDILLWKLKRSTPRKSRGDRRNVSKRFTQSEPKLDGMSEDLELAMQEQQECELMTKQANFGSEEADVSPSIEVKDPVDQGHETGRIKIYIRRSKYKRKEP